MSIILNFTDKKTIDIEVFSKTFELTDDEVHLITKSWEILYANDELQLRCILFIIRNKVLFKTINQKLNPFFDIFIKDKKPEEVNLQQIFTCMNDILVRLDSLSILNPSYIEALSGLINDFNISFKLYSKLESLLNIFFSNTSEFNNSLKNLIWVIFIFIRAKVVSRSKNILECLPLLIAIIQIIFQNLKMDQLPIGDNPIPNTINSINGEDLNSQEQDNKRLKELMKILCQHANYNSADQLIIISNYSDAIKNCFNKMDSFEYHTEDKFGLKDVDSMSRVLDIFSGHYENYLKLTYFDERLFTLNSRRDVSPIKKMPFKDVHFNLAKNSNNDHEFAKPSVCRSLNFDNLKHQFLPGTGTPHASVNPNPVHGNLNQVAQNQNQGGHDSKKFFENFSANSLYRTVSPSPNLTSLDYQMFTPCTRVIELASWVKAYSSDWKIEHLQGFLSFVNENNFYTIIDGLFNKMFTKISNLHIKIVTNREVIRNLSFKLFCQLLLREEKRFYKHLAGLLLENISFIKSVFIVAFEIILFIENTEELSIFEMIEYIDLDLYEFWKIINPLNKFDALIPNTIKYYFNTIEIQIFSNYIWKTNNKFRQTIGDFLSEKDSNSSNVYTTLKNLSPNLNINPSQTISANSSQSVNSLYSQSANPVNMNNMNNSYSNDTLESSEFNNQSLFVYDNKTIFLEHYTQQKLKNNDEMADKLKDYMNLNPMNIFVRRIFNYCMNLNKDICDVLGLSVDTAKCIEETIKTLIHNHINIFTDKHLDQILVSTIYITQLTKKDKIVDKLFNYIIVCYNKVKNENSSASYKSIFSNVKHLNQSYDIIGFYNNIFVPLYNEHFLKNDEEKVVKKRKVSNVEDINYLQRKLKFEDDSAYVEIPVIYDAVKTASISSALTTPKKSNNDTPNKLIKTPGLERIRATLFIEDKIDMDIKFSPSSHKNSNFKQIMLGKALFNSKLKDSAAKGICFGMGMGLGIGMGIDSVNNNNNNNSEHKNDILGDEGTGIGTGPGSESKNINVFEGQSQIRTNLFRNHSFEFDCIGGDKKEKVSPKITPEFNKFK